MSRRRCPTASGFTLVELLVAAFVVSLCLAGAYHLLQACLLAEQRGGSRLSAMTQVRLFCHDLQKNLGSAALLEGQGGQFEGQQDSIAFLSLGEPDAPGRDPVPAKRVAYRFLSGLGTGGPGSVERQEELAAGGEVLSDSGAWVPVLEDVETFSLEYFDPEGGWTERWTATRRLPGAVKVSLTAGNPAGAVSCTTVVRVPAAEM
jgi:prepilin-type N-terminal cleavage/methylation domain-containing protein